MSDDQPCNDSESGPLIKNISADDTGVTEIESLCMECHEQGTTRLLMTRIPFFNEIVIMSFDCPHCHFKENEIKPASEVQEKGIRYKLKVDGSKMMSRQIVKQASAMFRIEELDFEAPEFTSKGSFTTVEGLFVTAISGLEQQQPVRKAINPDLAQKIEEVIHMLEKYKTGEVPFTLILEDISGNSFIENPFAPDDDPTMKVEQFKRTKLQDAKLNIAPLEESENPSDETEKTDKKEDEEKQIDTKSEVLEFPGNCQICQNPCVTRMKLLDIPHFKEVVIMAVTCDACGYKSNEVKGGGGIEPLGTKIKFKITDMSDLSRDVLTSESCQVSIPELDLDIYHRSEGGKFTTVEGLLSNIQETLGRLNPFAVGDSADGTKENKIKNLKEELQKVIDGKRFLSLVLDDPLGNSYLQNTYAPDDDPNITIEKYKRTSEQDEELGIADMKV